MAELEYLGVPETAPPEIHKAQMWAAQHGAEINAADLTGLPRAERFAVLDQMSAGLDRSDAPYAIKIWQGDVGQRVRDADGTAWSRWNGHPDTPVPGWPRAGHDDDSEDDGSEDGAGEDDDGDGAGEDDDETG